MSDEVATGPSLFWDGYGLDKPNTGIFSHAKSFARELGKLGITPTIVGTEACSSLFPELQILAVPEAKMFKKIANSKVVWPNRAQQFLTKTLQETGRIDETVIVHGLSNLNLPFDKSQIPNLKKVVTIHDLIPLLAPKTVSRAYYRQFKFLLPRVVEAADRIIAVSNWTANGLRHLFPALANKIIVIPNGFSSFDPKQMFDDELIQTGTTLKLLSVSRHESYKRFELLFDILYKKREFKMVLVTDSKGKIWAEKAAAGLIKVGSLRVVSNLDSKTLKKLYRESNAIVHPSLYEGFCLPASEALASGTPVVYHGGTGLDETVGNVVGVPMNENATVFDWISGIEYAANLKFTQKFHRDIGEHIDQNPKWNQAAQVLANLYLDLHNS